MRRVTRATLARANAEREWRQALVLARASGESYVDIAVQAGVSDERVRQVVAAEAASDPEIAELLRASSLRST